MLISEVLGLTPSWVTTNAGSGTAWTRVNGRLQVGMSQMTGSARGPEGVVSVTYYHCWPVNPLTTLLAWVCGCRSCPKEGPSFILNMFLHLSVRRVPVPEMVEGVKQIKNLGYRKTELLRSAHIQQVLAAGLGLGGCGELSSHIQGGRA